MSNQAQATLPNQETAITLDRETFKKDQNFVVVPEEHITEHDSLEPGDNVMFYTENSGDKHWAGTGMVTHCMKCYILDIPNFILTGHQDPMLKNPMALYHSLQSRLGRRLIPTDLVYCIGFRIIANND